MPKKSTTPSSTREKLSKSTRELWKDPEYRKKVIAAIKKKAASDPNDKERRRKAALKNPYFAPGEGHINHTKDKWTKEHKENVRKHITAYNKSKKGKKMASRRSKKLFEDEAVRQRYREQAKERNAKRIPELQEHAKKYLAPYNEERHQKAERKKAIERAWAMYRGDTKPAIKPLPNQPDEYYDRLDEFFAEGF